MTLHSLGSHHPHTHPGPRHSATVQLLSWLYLKYLITEKSAAWRIESSLSTVQLWLLDLHSEANTTNTMNCLSYYYAELISEIYMYLLKYGKKQSLWFKHFERAAVFVQKESHHLQEKIYFHPTQLEVWVFYTTGRKKHPCYTCWKPQSNLNTVWTRLPTLAAVHTQPRAVFPRRSIIH